MPNDHDMKNWTHAVADNEPSLRLHYVTAGQENALWCSCTDFLRPGGSGGA